MESQHPYHHEVQPERGKRTSALYGERVVMVDDMDSMLAAFARALTEATGGRAFFLLHQGELPEPLVDTILAVSHDVVLLDYHLARGQQGTNVARALKTRAPRVCIIGFSTDASAANDFRAAGADGFVTKTPGDPKACGAAIAMLVEEQSGASRQRRRA